MKFGWSTRESSSPVPFGGKGYVRYDFEIPPTACFSLESANHHFTTKDFCAGNGPAFVTHASDTEFLINLFGYEYGMVEGEILSEAMVMIGPGGYRYVLNIYSADDPGNPAETCDLHYYSDGIWGFECALPDNPLRAHLCAIDGNEGEHPTHVIIRLDDPGHPGNLEVIDRNPAIGEIEPEIRFGGAARESEIALYEIVTSWDWDSRYVSTGGGGPYTAVFGESEIWWNAGSRFVRLHYMDTGGNPFVRYADYPVVDNISDLGAFLEYKAEGFKEFEPVLDHQNARFTDFDLDEGRRTGMVEWTIPETGNFVLIAYDLYYVMNGGGVIRGKDRVYLPEALPGTFRHKTEDVPPAAESLAVVPLLKICDSSEDDVLWYYADPFHQQG